MRASLAAAACCVLLAALPLSLGDVFRARVWGVIPIGGEISSAVVEEHENRNAARSSCSTSRVISSVSGGEAASSAAFVGGTKVAPISTGQTTNVAPKKGPATGELPVSASLVPEKVGSARQLPENQSNSTQSDRPLKILFLSSDTGGGHRASAEALANQFQRLYPGSTYELFDIWTDVDEVSWPYCTIKDTYVTLSSTPWKWRTLYHISNNAAYAKFVDWHSDYMNEELIRRKMDSYDFDVVVSVHPTMNYVPLQSTRAIADKRGKEIPFFTVVTDFGSGHCTWFSADVERIYLASDSIKKIALKRGKMLENKMVMTGLPIRRDFALQADALGDRTSQEGKEYQAKIREELGIDKEKKMVLVMGGGEGVGSLSDIVNELYAKLKLQGVNATICVVCGRNERLKNDIETRCWDTVISQSLNSYESLRSRFYNKMLSWHAHRSRRIQAALDRAAARAEKGKDVAASPGCVDVVPLGFVKNMAEFMVAADVLVSKAGPGTIAEAAAVGLPVMLTSHLPGQEAGNVDIVLTGGFGDFCEDPETIALEVACWLRDDNLLDIMTKKAKAVGQPHAAEEICTDIGTITHQYMERNCMKANMANRIH